MKKRMLGALLSTTMLTSLLVGGQALPSSADTAASAPAVGMYEDFEYMTNDTAASYWKFNTGDKPVFSIEDGKGENGSKALKLEFKGTGQGWSSYKLPIVPKGQAMTLWYRMEKDTQFALAFRKWEGSTWTDLGFVGLHKEDGNWSTTSVSAGAHKSTVKYSDSSDVTENNQDIMLGMEVGGTPGDIVIYIDSIQFHNVDGEGNLVDLPDSDGDQTALKTALAGKKALYDGNNADQAYTVKSYAAFKTAYEEASALAADAKQSVVDYTLKKFNYYVDSLRPTNFDYTKIDEAIQAADAFYATNPENTYTAHALGLLKGYYDAAKDMRTNVTGETQKNYDDAAAALANSLAQLKADGAKVTETPVYPKDAQDTLLDDFESYDGLADIPVGGGGGSTDDGWGLDTNESFKNRLDTTNPISGQKSLKISWTDLPDSVWGAFRLYMYHTGNYPLRNQAITFTIKVEFDYNMTIVLYNYSDPNQIYSTTVAIKGSKNPQTITVPFNQFTNSNKNSYGYGEPMTAERFASFKNQWNCLKIQVDRTCVPESGEMWLDCFKLTANEGPQEAAPPPDGQGGDSSDSSDSSGGESSGEIIEPDDPQPDESDGFHVLQNFEDMTAEKLAVLAENGVTVVDPAATYVDPRCSVAPGVTLLPGTILRGHTAVDRDSEIGPNSMVRDCRIGQRTTVNASQLNESTVGSDTTVGPFTYVRPGCTIGDHCRVGDFVEVKNSVVGDGTKISHLTYVGDSDVGQRVNFGCGTVTTNYDGHKKFRCTIGDDVFLGCNTNLIAPVTVGDRAYTAAGSTVTDDVPNGALAIARTRQTNKPGWADRLHSLWKKDK